MDRVGMAIEGKDYPNFEMRDVFFTNSNNLIKTWFIPSNGLFQVCVWQTCLQLNCYYKEEILSFLIVRLKY